MTHKHAQNTDKTLVEAHLTGRRDQTQISADLSIHVEISVIQTPHLLTLSHSYIDVCAFEYLSRYAQCNKTGAQSQTHKHIDIYCSAQGIGSNRQTGYMLLVPSSTLVSL